MPRPSCLTEKLQENHHDIHEQVLTIGKKWHGDFLIVKKSIRSQSSDPQSTGLGTGRCTSWEMTRVFMEDREPEDEGIMVYCHCLLGVLLPPVHSILRRWGWIVAQECTCLLHCICVSDSNQRKQHSAMIPGV